MAAFAHRFQASIHFDVVHYSLPYFDEGEDRELQFRPEDKPAVDLVINHLLRLKMADPKLFTESATAIAAFADWALKQQDMRIPCDARKLLWVGADGSVMLCYVTFPLGNLHEKRLSEILYQEAHHQAARDAFQLNCPNCPSRGRVARREACAIVPQIFEGRSGPPDGALTGMIRVAHLLPNMVTGGRERIVADLCAQATGVGIQPIVITYDPPPAEAAQIDLGHTPVFALDRRDPAFTARLRDRLTTSRIDVLHAQGHVPAALARPALGDVPMLATLHIALGNGWRWAMPVARGLRAAAAVTAVSDDLARRYRALANQPIATIPTGVDLDRFTPAHDRVPTADFTIGIAARLHPVKRHGHAVAACRILQDRGVRYRLRIAGQGSEAARLTHLARGLNVVRRRRCRHARMARQSRRLPARIRSRRHPGRAAGGDGVRAPLHRYPCRRCPGIGAGHSVVHPPPRANGNRGCRPAPCCQSDPPRPARERRQAPRRAIFDPCTGRRLCPTLSQSSGQPAHRHLDARRPAP